MKQTQTPQEKSLYKVVLTELRHDIQSNPEFWASYILQKESTQWQIDYLDIANRSPEALETLSKELGFNPAYKFILGTPPTNTNP